MSEQQPQPQTPPQSPPPPGYFVAYPYPAPPNQQGQWAQRRWDKMTWKQRLGAIGGLALLLLILIAWNSCHPAVPVQRLQAAQRQPAPLPANPQSIESQHEQALRNIEQLNGKANDLKKRLASGGMPATTPTGTGPGAPAQQDLDKQFWHEVRLENWKREHEAPYASGVGFVTRREREERDQVKGPDTEVARLREQFPQPPAVIPPTASPDATPHPNPADPPPQSPEKYPFDQADGPLHRLDEGTTIPATLMNQIDGEFAGPVICQISEDVYDASGQHLLIPAGSKVLGEGRPVQSNNQRRLAIPFHRVIMADGYSLSLDKDPGLDQTGASALSGRVNNHLLQTFGISVAVGALSGLAQIGNTASSYSPFYGFREGVSEQTAISSEQILNRFLNRNPGITIPPGKRVKIILLRDLPDIPEYANHHMPVNR